MLLGSRAREGGGSRKEDSRWLPSLCSRRCAPPTRDLFAPTIRARAFSRTASTDWRASPSRKARCALSLRRGLMSRILLFFQVNLFDRLLIGGIPPDESSAEEQGSSAMLRHSVARHLLLSFRAKVELLPKFPASVIARSAVLPSMTSKSMGRSTTDSMTARQSGPALRHVRSTDWPETCRQAFSFYLSFGKIVPLSAPTRARDDISYTVSVAMLCARNLGRTGPLNFLCSVRSSAPGKGGSPAQSPFARLSPRTLSGLLTLLARASIQSSTTMTIYTSPFPSVEVNTESVHSFILSPTKIATYKDRAALIDATTGQQVCVLSSCFSSFACELTRARAP